MLQVVAKSTFISTIGEEYCRVRLLASPRSKSAELPCRGRSLSKVEAVSAMQESQQIVRLNALPGFCPDVRASSNGAARLCRTSMLDGGEASLDRTRSTRVARDGANVLHKALPRGCSLEVAEELCDNQQQGRPDDAAAAGVGEKAPESSSAEESASISELRKLQERLRAACFSTGKVSELAAVAAKLPVAARDKLGLDSLSCSSLSTMSPDTGSDGEVETPKSTASFSIGSLPSVDDFDIRQPQFGAEAEPHQFEFEMSIEEIDGQGEGTLQQVTPPVIAAATGVASSPWPLPPPEAAGASPRQVPRCLNLAEKLESTMSHSGDAPFTTLMVRNIPYRYTQRELMAELEEVGLAGTFDFLYLPLDVEARWNVGYAFVNFINASLAKSALTLIPKHKFRLHRRAGCVNLAFASVARIQGFQKNMKNYTYTTMISSSMKGMKEHRPVIIANISDMLGGEA